MFTVQHCCVSWTLEGSSLYRGGSCAICTGQVSRLCVLSNIYIGSIAVTHSQFGQGIVPIAMSNVGCDGLEMTLLECPYSEPGSCSHSADVGVRCMVSSGET